MKYRNSSLQLKKKKSVKKLCSKKARKNLAKHFTAPLKSLVHLQQDVVGKVVFQKSPGYNKDRKIFNNVYSAYPEVIVYAAVYTDVRIALKFAQDNQMQTSIRSGGHSLAGYCICNGLVIDMSLLNNVYVDVKNHWAVVESGCTFEKLFPILEQYGLHLPGGGCPTVAVAGYMQGGGYGLTSRMFGMHCDSVLEVTVMLADGLVVVANNKQNQDLFWAIRGGTGGNFGVLLSIKYQVYPLGEIQGIKIKWDIENNLDNSALALQTMQAQYLKAGKNPELGIETILCTDSDGIKKVMFCATYIGSAEKMNQVLAPILAVPGADVALRTCGTYSKVNADVLEGTPNLPPGIMAYTKSSYFAKQLSTSNWQSILDFFKTAPNKYTMVDMECYGGKINEIEESANAFIHRNATMDFFCDVFFNKNTDDQKENEIWLNQFYTFLEPYGNGHSYQNYPNRNQTDFRFAYWGNYYGQLVKIKAKYDPQNFFQYQQSIGMLNSIENPKSQKYLFDSTAIVYEEY